MPIPADEGAAALEGLVAEALRTHYRIEPSALEPSDRGKDFFASVFRVFVGEARPRYVVKVRSAGAGRDPAAAVARYLADAGVPGIVAPIRTTTGAVSTESGDRSVKVYPFVDGRVGIEMHLSDAPTCTRAT